MVEVQTIPPEIQQVLRDLHEAHEDAQRCFERARSAQEQYMTETDEDKLIALGKAWLENTALERQYQQRMEELRLQQDRWEAGAGTPEYARYWELAAPYEEANRALTFLRRAREQLCARFLAENSTKAGA